MAKIEYINYTPWRESFSKNGIQFETDKLSRRIEHLPQIFWRTGEGWAEANVWALEKVIDKRIDIKTAKSLMKHLTAYACFLEENQLDWRHFPIRLAERAIVRFRGELVSSINNGRLAASTAKARMSAIIQFYRYANSHHFISSDKILWREKAVAVKYFDAHGFQRTLSRVTTDLAIRNRKHSGTKLEEGLLPLSEAHMSQLLEFTSHVQTQELHLMLTVGFYTGARLGTITTLGISNLEQAYSDPFIKGFLLVRVGPGTNVETKFDVAGELLMPEFLIKELKEYAYSTRRLKREAKSKKEDRGALFLTKQGRPYSPNSISRLMTDLRRKGSQANLKFMAKFKFHQTRATYGTWLMKLALSVTNTSAAIAFVKNAMFHKNESTTFGYIKFIEQSKGKEEAATEFNRAFTGLKHRNWNDFEA
jgi:integrase